MRRTRVKLRGKGHGHGSVIDGKPFSLPLKGVRWCSGHHALLPALGSNIDPNYYVLDRRCVTIHRWAGCTPLHPLPAPSCTRPLAACMPTAPLHAECMQARDNGKADVIVCLAQHLKKPKGAKPGQVCRVGRGEGKRRVTLVKELH